MPGSAPLTVDTGVNAVHSPGQSGLCVPGAKARYSASPRSSFSVIPLLVFESVVCLVLAAKQTRSLPSRHLQSSE